MKILPDTDCPECIKRREAIQKWLDACRAWSKKPFGPMPLPPVSGMKYDADEKSENKA